MPFTIEKLPGEPILFIVHESKQVLDDLPEAIKTFQKAIDAQTEPVYLVVDIRKLSLGLDDLPQSASVVALKPEKLLHHPMIRESLLVSTDGLIRLAAQGMRTATFGNVKVRIFNTPDEALAYSREQIAMAAAQDAGQSQGR